MNRTLLIALLSAAAIVSGIFSCSPLEPMGAAVVVTGKYALYDGGLYGTAGNDDDSLNAGETVRMNIELAGFDTSLKVQATLACSDTYVTIDPAGKTASFGSFTGTNEFKNLLDQSGSSYGWSQMDSAASPKCYLFSVKRSCPGNHEITFELHFSNSEKETWVDSITLIVHSYDVHLKPTLTAVYDAGQYGTTGDGNTKANRNETVRMNVYLANQGSSKARGVTAVLSSADPYVTIAAGGNTGYYGSITANGSASLAYGSYSQSYDSCYLISISKAAPDSHWIPFTMAISDSLGYSWSTRCSVMVYPSDVRIEYSTSIICDSIQYASYGISGNSDGLLGAGESVRLNIKVHNASNSDAPGVYIILSSLDTLVTVDAAYDSAYYGDIPKYGYCDILSPVGASITASSLKCFRVSLSHWCPGYTSLKLKMYAKDTNGNSFIDTLSLAGNNPLQITCQQYFLFDGDSLGASGNGNDTANPGEKIRMNVEGRINCQKSLYSIAGVLSTYDSYITIDSMTGRWGNHNCITSGPNYKDLNDTAATDGAKISGISQDPSDRWYLFTISPQCPRQHAVIFNLIFSDADANKCITQFSVPVR